MIQKLDMDSIKKSYEADLLKLASDMSRWSEYESRQLASSRKVAIAKVLRLKSENRKGAGIIVQHMEKTCRFRANSFAEEHDCMIEAGCTGYCYCPVLDSPRSHNMPDPCST